jgi:hypothetical protein
VRRARLVTVCYGACAAQARPGGRTSQRTRAPRRASRSSAASGRSAQTHEFAELSAFSPLGESSGSIFLLPILSL